MSDLLPNRFGFAVRRLLATAGGLQVGVGTRIATGVKFYDRYVEIGRDTWIGMDTRIMSTRDGRVRIGARVDIAPMCLIGSGTHELGGPGRRAGKGRGEEIAIGNGCWLGMGCIVLPGVSLGEGCVVAAGAVVTRGVYAENSLLGGVPARTLRELPGV